MPFALSLELPFSSLHPSLAAVVFQAQTVLYLLLSLATVGVAWKTRDRPRSMLRQQVLSWWLIFPVLSLALLLYPVGSMLLSVLICVLAARELADLCPRQRGAFLLTCAVFGTVCLGLAWWRPTSTLLPHPIWLLAGLLVAYHLTPSSRWRMLLCAFILACNGVASLVLLAGLPIPVASGLAWTFYLLAVTCLNDVGQFIGGSLFVRRFGRHAIAPTISPNKTWQGLAGGLLTSLVVSVWLGQAMQLASVSTLITLAFILSPVGLLGDLLFSAVKRRVGIKDFSVLIPGHGGMLDRADSLVLTAPTLLVFLQYFP